MKTIVPAQLHQLLTTQPDLALLDVNNPKMTQIDAEKEARGRLVQELEPA